MPARGKLAKLTGIKDLFCIYIHAQFSLKIVILNTVKTIKNNITIVIHLDVI